VLLNAAVPAPAAEAVDSEAAPERIGRGRAQAIATPPCRASDLKPNAATVATSHPLTRPAIPRLILDEAPARNRPIAASQWRHVGFVSLVGVEVGAADAALTSALSRCRERGDLKVVIYPGAHEPACVRRVCESLGFMFARLDRTAGRLAIVFYTDLYYSPSRTDSLARP
jgi:hypothetical protein